MTSENIKIEFGDGGVITIDSDCFQNEALRKWYADLVGKDIRRLQAALGRRYPTVADYQAELARAEELMRTELPGIADRLAQFAVFNAAMANRSVQEFVAHVSNDMADTLRAKMNSAKSDEDDKWLVGAGALMLAHRRGITGVKAYSLGEIRKLIDGLNYRQLLELQRIAERLSRGETEVQFERNENPPVH
jgi:hypothetical protein